MCEDGYHVKVYKIIDIEASYKQIDACTMHSKSDRGLKGQNYEMFQGFTRQLCFMHLWMMFTDHGHTLGKTHAQSPTEVHGHCWVHNGFGKESGAGLGWVMEDSMGPLCGWHIKINFGCQLRR